MPDVLTQRDGNIRTGANLYKVRLDTHAVNVRRIGKLPECSAGGVRMELVRFSSEET